MSAAPAGARTETLRRPAAIGRLWLGVLAGPVVALLQQELGYALVPLACAGGRELPLHLSHGLALLLIVGGGLLSLGDWRRAGGPDDAGGPAGRTRFMAAIGLLSAVIFGLAVVAHWIAVIAFGVCQNAL